MKNTRIIFLRHAETEKDSTKNAALWDLSKEGEENAERVAQELEAENIDIIYTSEEKKAYSTAQPIAKRTSKEIHSSFHFNEIARGDKFLSKEDFEKEKELQLSNLDYQAFDGESGKDALLRFREGVLKVTRENEGKTILIVSHGTILSIYFADLLDYCNDIFGRWRRTGFCSYGIVENGEVIKDIVV